MERLTINDLNKVCYDPWELCGMDSHCTKGCHEEGGCTKGCNVLKMYRKLAEYEDLEEQGKLLKLPVAVGDKVYSISDGKVLEWEVKELWDGTIWIDGTFIDCEDLGKTVYTSRADAEATLNAEENAEWKEHLSRRFCQVE